MGITLRENPTDSPDIARHPFLVRCDYPDCVWCVSATDKQAALDTLKNHICPWFYDMTERISDMAKGMTQFQTMFSLLDKAMDDLDAAKIAADSTEQARLKGFMQGLAECIVVTMVPIFPDTRAVAMEAKKRHDSRLAGIEHQSPGVDYTWKPGGGRGDAIKSFVPDSKKYDNEEPSPIATRRPAASRRAGVGVTDVKTWVAAVDKAIKDSIRKALASGMFAEAEMATTYNLKLDEVQFILSEVVQQ